MAVTYCQLGVWRKCTPSWLTSVIVINYSLVKRYLETAWDCIEVIYCFQGEVEQISLMKPKAESEHDEGMLEYLEDIIGTNCYKEPIENAEKAVEELNEKRGEKVIFFSFRNLFSYLCFI